MDEKVTSNSNIDVWAIPLASLTSISSPSAAEAITSGVRLTTAIAWNGSKFPANEASKDVDDRSLDDRGNATSRGFAAFAASLNFFRPKDILDTTSDYGKAYQFFKTTRVPVVLLTRVLQRTTGGVTAPTAGDWVNVFQFISASFVDDTEGEDSYKYTVNFLPQGNLAVNTQFKNATAVTLAPLTLALAVGATGVVRATLGSKRATQVVAWASSNDSVATVSSNGVVTAVVAGTANITATHAAATGATTPCIITVT